MTATGMTWIGWALLSAVFAAATAILAKIGVAHIDSNLATAIRTTVIFVFAWVIALALGNTRRWRRSTVAHGSFLGLSGLATGLSWLCYFRALQLGPASRVAPIDKLSVVLVILFAWIFLAKVSQRPSSSVELSSRLEPSSSSTHERANYMCFPTTERKRVSFRRCSCW